MARNNRSIVTLFTALGVFSSLSIVTAQDNSSEPALPRINTVQLEWSKNATEAQTAQLIKQAELLLQQKIDTQGQAATADAATSQPVPQTANTVITQTETVIATPAITAPASIDTPIATTPPTAPAVPTQSNAEPMPANESSAWSLLTTAMVYWVPGVLSLVITIAMLLYAKFQLKKANRAGHRASILIAEIQDLQKNIKQWELENHYNHISEMSVHIEAMQETVSTAKEVRNNVEETINKGIDLNQKSIEILRKANKELSRSLTDQVSQLEQQLKETVESELQKIDQAATDKIGQLEQKKSQIIAEVSKSSHGINSGNITSNDNKPQTTMSLIDIINKELNSIKNKPTSTTTANTTKPVSAMSHADMLRESIALQKAALSNSSSLSAKPAIVTPAATTTNTNLHATTIDKESVSSKVNTSPIPTPATTIVESAKTPSVEIGSESHDTTKTKNEALTSINSDSKYAGLDNKALMDKLAHAEKWRSYKLAAEICAELAHRSPEKPEIFDIWGQMLAKQSHLENGQDAINLLKEACQKMQKAANLDATNYKVFNNWGVILKNLALTYTDNSETEKTLSLARRKFETSLSLNPKNHEALNNWGNALLIQARFRTGTLHESLLQSACQKFEQAISLKSDKDVAFYGWGNALFKLANCKTNQDARNKLLHQAQEKWLTANQLNPGIASKELRTLRSMLPTLGEQKTASGKVVTDYKFKTLSK